MTFRADQVRTADEGDAAVCAAIYAPYVRDTAISFEMQPPSAEHMAERIASARRSHAWLVLEDGTDVVGYAYGGRYKARLAYQWSCEVSVYLDREARHRGGGRLLYRALLDRLADRGYLMAVAGMTLPNAASVGLHLALSFEPIGTFRRVGWKHGAWHDVAWMQRALSTFDHPPGELL